MDEAHLAHSILLLVEGRDRANEENERLKAQLTHRDERADALAKKVLRLEKKLAALAQPTETENDNG